MSARQCAGATAVVAVVAVVLAGCGSDSDDRTGDRSDAPASSESSPAESSPAETPSATESTPESTPEVAPATGPVIKVRGMRVNVPRGWEKSIAVTAGQTAFPRGVIGTMIGVNLFPNSDLYTIDELGDEQVGRLGPGGKRLDNLVLDGQQVYHLVGSPEPGVEEERFGTIVDDDRLALEFRFANKESRAERDEIVQSVLATARIG